MNIDGENLRLGRLATVAAKKALLGEEVNIINVDKIIITGDKRKVFEKYEQRRARGSPSTGPFYPRMPTKFVKRAIRGMLPYKQTKGREALERIKCYTKAPAGMEAETIKEAHIDESMTSKFTTVATVCRLLGGKDE